ncbi:hypothetical protein EDC01DRAFT_626080 [Geopyxis carbonaria]|nr:hypothetical protein EDC01DRAFT_626080 [Geopyxis carbonaria]
MSAHQTFTITRTNTKLSQLDSNSRNGHSRTIPVPHNAAKEANRRMSTLSYTELELTQALAGIVPALETLEEEDEDAVERAGSRAKINVTEVVRSVVCGHGSREAGQPFSELDDLNDDRPGSGSSCAGYRDEMEIFEALGVLAPPLLDGHAGLDSGTGRAGPEYANIDLVDVSGFAPPSQEDMEVIFERRRQQYHEFLTQQEQLESQKPVSSTKSVSRLFTKWTFLGCANPGPIIQRIKTWWKKRIVPDREIYAGKDVTSLMKQHASVDRPAWNWDGITETAEADPTPSRRLSV